MPRVNPYENVNWQTTEKIKSVTHTHATTQSRFEDAYAHGIRHFAITHYNSGGEFGSKPVYPLEDWFENIPADAIASPNSEHVNGAHFTSIGSFFKSGGHNGDPRGLNMTREEAVQQIKEQLQFPDGGGTNINHASNFKTVVNFLDIDPEIVLGMEIYNWKRQEYLYDQYQEPFDVYIKVWDRVLATGRRCWGFVDADFPGNWNEDTKGVGIVLVDNLTEYEILKAYRQGAFYGALYGDDLGFSMVEFNGSSVNIETEGADKIRVITEKGIMLETNGNTVSYTVPRTSTGAYNITYVRIEAESENDMIFSQPIMFRNQEDVDRLKRKERNKKFLALG